MDARFIRAPFLRILVGRPRHHAFGLLIPDVTVLLQIAKSRDVPIVFLRGTQGEDSLLLHLAVEGVSLVDNRFVRSRTASRVWTCLLGLIRVKDSVASPRHRIVNASLVVLDAGLMALAALIVRLRIRRDWNGAIRTVQSRLTEWLERKPQVVKRFGRAVSELLGRFKQSKRDRDVDFRESVLQARGRILMRIDESRRSIPPARQVHHGYDVRRLCLEQPLRVGLQPADEDRARQAARALGLHDRPLVALHVRDGGSKRDATTGGFIRDISRDAQIESYLPAVDLLVSRGYTVVRIGDPGMRPCRRTGLVDLATHAEHSLLLDLWCVKHCRFFIAGDSGPYLLSWLFNVPCLAVNITNVLGVFPLRPSDLYMIKTLQEVQTGRDVPLSEMLTSEFLAPLRRRIAKEGLLRYLDNDERDILEAAREMDDGLRAPGPETPMQRAYRRRIEEIRNGPLVRAKLSEKTGSGEVLMGAGRVVHAFAARHFGTGRPGEGAQ